MLLISALWIFGFADSMAASAVPVISPPDNALTAEQLGVIINDDDQLSIAIGNYYQLRRKIPPANVVHIRFNPGKNEMSPGEFAVLKRSIDERLPPAVQALALTWAAPYRVGCMSVTAAFTFGYDVRYCAEGCQLTAASSYADSNTAKPFSILGIRPTMMLAATSKQSAFALIERGIEADGSIPNGAAYLIETGDVARSARKVLFPGVQQLFGAQLPVHIEQAPSLENAKDVMLYITGAINVP
ncbi:MAG TPA: TIGR03790 family protein, partial [Spongiibacteraceae bacterium]|nr:TIGR03790 family protein [Spongiibacteraceae bacterium]